MLLMRVLFGVFAICGLIFLIIGLFTLDTLLFVIALLFGLASGLVAWEAKQRFHSLFHS